MAQQLDAWLQQATRKLSAESAAQVRGEIQEHYDSACEIALHEGLDAREAEGRALDSLGDARSANREYRKVLLTCSEARVLRESNWEARGICAVSTVKRALFAAPVALLLAGIYNFAAGHASVALTLFVGSLALAVAFVGPFVLPVYTVARSQAYRRIKWVAILGALLLAFGPHVWQYSWLLAASVWPWFYAEWVRANIRRKLPSTAWPKQLYL